MGGEGMRGWGPGRCLCFVCLGLCRQLPARTLSRLDSISSPVTPTVFKSQNHPSPPSCPDIFGGRPSFSAAAINTMTQNSSGRKGAVSLRRFVIGDVEA